MPSGTFDDDRGEVSIGLPGDNVSLDPIVIDDGCAMMLDAFSENERRCGITPTVGTNGNYRYCRRHMRMVADAGATTLQWDDARVVDDPDAPSPIDSDAPASVHGAARLGLVQALAVRVGALGDDVRAHDDDPAPVYYGAPDKPATSRGKR